MTKTPFDVLKGLSPEEQLQFWGRTLAIISKFVSVGLKGQISTDEAEDLLNDGLIALTTSRRGVEGGYASVDWRTLSNATASAAIYISRRKARAYRQQLPLTPNEGAVHLRRAYESDLFADRLDLMLSNEPGIDAARALKVLRHIRNDLDAMGLSRTQQGVPRIRTAIVAQTLGMKPNDVSKAIGELKRIARALGLEPVGEHLSLAEAIALGELDALGDRDKFEAADDGSAEEPE